MNLKIGNLKEEASRIEQVERQELFCHGCQKYVQFNMDLSLDGEHIIPCPVCGHKHYRIVKNGVITEARWGRDPSQSLPQYTNIGATTTNLSVSTTSTSSNVFLQQAWLNSTGVSTA